MRERRADAARKLLNRGGYNGGSLMPWGYYVVNWGGRLEIEPDPGKVPEVTECPAQRQPVASCHLLRRMQGSDVPHEDTELAGAAVLVLPA